MRARALSVMQKRNLFQPTVVKCISSVCSFTHENILRIVRCGRGSTCTCWFSERLSRKKSWLRPPKWLGVRAVRYPALLPPQRLTVSDNRRSVHVLLLAAVARMMTQLLYTCTDMFLMRRASSRHSTGTLLAVLAARCTVYGQLQLVRCCIDSSRPC